ncbi:PrgI family protein [Streptomonospora sp. S1-112]|uniref:PrgI family protein n=1 Tax=Streptomonospora mangrovi TaxID=2883123 RepID=A0A9X3SHD7_9ACTN|nr:PrgI family protein [Streptomonospora mangrovi]MDA0565154.1 PrgI family protein [Streptomonospora mangrovi]
MARVRMPADIEREDRILAGLSARQLLIIGLPGIGVWAVWTALRDVVPLPVLAAVAVPLMGAAVAAALVRRDGLNLNQFLFAALRFHRSPKRRATTAAEDAAEVPSWVSARPDPLPAPLALPLESIGDSGVIDLGEHGCAVVLSCSTVNFALRTPEEQASLVAGFAAYLNSLSAPVQVLIRAESVRLDPLIAAVDEAAPALPHPALERAARDHADYLADLGRTRDLLYRRVLVVLREPGGTGRHGAATLLRRAEDATRALAAAGSTAAVLPGADAAAVLATAADPARAAAPPEGLAPPDAIITGPRPAEED